MNDTLTHFLHRHDCKTTLPRQRVFAALEAAGPITTTELVERLQGAADQASVYRTLALFERLGIVHHLVLGGRRVLELTDELSHHHHHLTCTRCGHIQPLSDEGLEHVLHTLIAGHGFVATGHTLEVSGLCRECAASS